MERRSEWTGQVKGKGTRLRDQGQVRERSGNEGLRGQ